MIYSPLFFGHRLTHTHKRGGGVGDGELTSNLLESPPSNRFNVAIQFGPGRNSGKLFAAQLKSAFSSGVRSSSDVSNGGILEIRPARADSAEWKGKLRNLLAEWRGEEVGGRLERRQFFGTADLVFRSEDFSLLPSARLLLSGAL